MHILEPASNEFPVVAIGASAGGLESLERLFSSLPRDTGMAFVVLQHLSPDFKSLMDELLGRRTTMPICHAESGMLVKPNTVYLLPPMKEMIIRQRQLLLSDRDPRLGLTLPIDMFFRSLAQDVGNRAIAVVLSGSGSDGSRGLQEVSRAGGMVFSESPDTAQFNGMPLSAMRTGMVDQVLSPEQIASALASVAYGKPRGDEQAGEEERGVDAILRLLRDEFSIDFSHYKASTVVRRIERRLALNRSIDIDMYVDQLRSDPRELSSLYEDLLIGVTRFFRDDAAFDVLEQRIVPELAERATTTEQIRVWVPGCATGQEAYSIAMLLHEQLAARQKPANVKILATDVHKASLEMASSGIYTQEQLAGVGADRLSRHFTPKGNAFQISPLLRETIVFAPHNLIRDAPFTKLDLIACRNLLIYFQPHAQKTVLTLFHFALRPGGYLFLGSSESPGGLLDEFDTIDEHAKIYRKRREIGLPRDFKLPLPRATAARQPSVTTPRTSVSPQLLSVYDRLLDRFMPPSFLVDDNGHLLDTFGGLESMLKIRPRRPSQHLLEFLSGDLRTVVAGALHRVKHDVESVRYPGVELPGHGRPFALVAEPIRSPQGTVTHVLMSLCPEEAEQARALIPPFVDVPAPGRRETAESDRPVSQDFAGDRIRVLEEELAYSKEHLQSAIEEHEASNEELQATNEELIAANEELQSTNEELHSVNEELYTVNAEYQKKNAELQELNDDIEHLLNGTNVATMFLDRQLCIRRFTPGIAGIFHVLPQDIGRSVRNFTHDLTYPTLIDDLNRVLHEGGTVECETRDSRNRCFFLRVLPYRARTRDSMAATPNGPLPDGVVLTLTDTSVLEQMRAKLARLSAIVESSDEAIVGMTLEGIVTVWNNGATRLYGYTPEEAIGRHVTVLYPQEVGREDIDGILRRIRENRPIDTLELVRFRKDGSPVEVAETFSPIFDEANNLVGVSAISHDISALVRARQEVLEREEQVRLLLDSTAEAIFGIDLRGVCTFCNSACINLLGYASPADLVGRPIAPLIQHTKSDGTAYLPEQSPIFRSMRQREGTHIDDEVLWRADGTSFAAEYWSHPIFRDGEIIGAVVTFLDISERREAEREVQEGVRRREQFLAMLSHELRNPLAAIISATRIIDNTAALDDKCRQAGRVVQRQAGHMARLLDDLLDVSRITYGRITLRTETIDVRDTTRSAIESLQPLLADHGTNLEIDLPDEPVLVNGDPARLQQIQANLLSNASKYSPHGGRVKIEVRREGADAMIRVSDRGRGITPEMLPRIFDLFVQSQQTIDRAEGGLGIGLTLLRSLVDLHGGRVEVHSDGPGAGSTFTVWLPLAPATAVSEAPAAARHGLVRSVVIVEDQPDARLMLQLLLESQGIEVFTASNGLEGAELIERVKPELALVDLGLPVMSGFELARRIRGDGSGKYTKLVALSGYGQEEDVAAALKAGFDEHLTKPTDIERLERLTGRPL